MIILILLGVVVIVGVFYPKKMRFLLGDGACASDMCKGFVVESCPKGVDIFDPEVCERKCYGWVYNCCDDIRYAPILLGKMVLGR